MRMIDACDLDEAVEFEVDRPAAPASAPPPVYSVAVQSYRRCHVDGLELDRWGNCARCAHERSLAKVRATRNALIALAVAVATVFALGGFWLWRMHADERAGRAAAIAISSRNKDRLTVYTMTSCPACSLAVAYMDSHNIPYVERSIDTSPHAMAELESLGGPNMVPTFVIQDEVITGFDPRGIMLEQALDKHRMRRISPPADSAP